jgi:hypothetical protein
VRRSTILAPELPYRRQANQHKLGPQGLATEDREALIAAFGRSE